MATVLDLIAGARDATLDEDATGYRTSDTAFLRYFNDGVREMVGLIPAQFSTFGEITCTAGATLQSAPAASIHLIDIHHIKDGGVVTRVDKGVLDRFRASWHTDTAAAAENFTTHPSDPNKFFIYPKAPTGQILMGEWAEVPAAAASINDVVATRVKETRHTALIYYMVARAESRDDEHVNSGRAKLMYQLFQATVMGQSEIVRQLIARVGPAAIAKEVA